MTTRSTHPRQAITSHSLIKQEVQVLLLRMNTFQNMQRRGQRACLHCSIVEQHQVIGNLLAITMQHGVAMALAPMPLPSSQERDSRTGPRNPRVSCTVMGMIHGNGTPLMALYLSIDHMGAVICPQESTQEELLLHALKH